MDKYWNNKKVIVTGGAGFLGSFVVEKLKEKSVEVFVPRSSEYDLTKLKSIKKQYSDFPANQVIHLAAVVGGIGANRENPGKYFYDNLMMGVQLIEEAQQTGIEKFVAVGTIWTCKKNYAGPIIGIRTAIQI